jgi:hypothetical protein
MCIESTSIRLTLAVVFIVRAFESFGLAFAFNDVLDAVVLVAVAAPSAELDVADNDDSSAGLVSDLSRASSSSLTRLNLSSPQTFLRNSWPA